MNAKAGQEDRQRRDNAARNSPGKKSNDEQNMPKSRFPSTVSCDADEIAPIIVGTDFHVGRQSVLFILFGFLSTPFRGRSGLLAPAHQDDAFDGVIISFAG